MLILKIKDLANGDPENKEVINFDLENKELSCFPLSEAEIWPKLSRAIGLQKRKQNIENKGSGRKIFEIKQVSADD